jgi:K+/H+ antiporter YhaU regulatory subunit KhtT
VPAPPDAAGRTIEQTDFRRRTGLSILTVVRDDGSPRGSRLLPDPALVLRADDAFVVIGPDDRIAAYLAEAGGPDAPPR